MRAAVDVDVEREPLGRAARGKQREVLDLGAVGASDRRPADGGEVHVLEKGVVQAGERGRLGARGGGHDDLARPVGPRRGERDRPSAGPSGDAVDDEITADDLAAPPVPEPSSMQGHRATVAREHQ